MDLSVSGLASGFDWKSVVDQLVQVERAPQQRLRAEQNTLEQRNNAFGSIKTQLAVLADRVAKLKDKTLYTTRQTATGDSTIATAAAATGAALGSYDIAVTQMAAAAKWLGAGGAGRALSETGDVSAVVMGSAGFSTAIRAGVFTVNGKAVTFESTDTLQGVFDKISTATGGTVTADYNASGDTISLQSASPIVLGSATDTSNFLQASKLFNNGSGTITSSNALGGVRVSAALDQANFGLDVVDGGAGEFKINGVSIQYSSTGDSVQNVLDRINSSAAGVLASYDAVNNRFQLTNKGAGDMGIAVEDVTGNFASVSGLTDGTLQRGKNLLYTINGGGQLTSQSNTITESSSGIAGLSITVNKLGATSVTVSADTAAVKGAIKDFIGEYNKVQALIENQTASSTDSKGKVTAGILAGDSEASAIATALRGSVFAPVTGLSGPISHLADLGIETNGNDNNLALADETELDAALAGNLTALADLFTSATNGIAKKLAGFLDETSGEGGSLEDKQALLGKQSDSIDTQIADMERLVQEHRQRLVDGFVAMETAQQNSNQQLQFLKQRFGASSS